MPLDAGVKLTGTVGRTDIGVLDVRTGDLRRSSTRRTSSSAASSATCSSSRTSAPSSPTAIPARGRSGQTYGADLRLATSRFLGQAAQPRRQRVRAPAASTKASRTTTGRTASRRTIRTTSTRRRSSLREIQENFKPALGFVQRDNVRLFRAAASYNPRPKDFLNIQQMYHDVYYTRFTRLDNGEVESWDLYVTLLDWHFKSGDNLHGMLDFNPTYERLFEPFEISPGVRAACRASTGSRASGATCCRRRPSGGSRAASTCICGNYWSGKAEQVTTVAHLQAAAAVHAQRQHEPDVRAAARGPLHRPHLHLERQLRRLAARCRSRT